jgi:hypothetical protein
MRRPSVAIVGGPERLEARYRRVGEFAGVDLYFHKGWVTAPGRIALDAIVRRCDRVLIVTDVNSHGAVKAARESAEAHGTRALFVRKLGVATFQKLLAEMGVAKKACA